MSAPDARLGRPFPIVPVSILVVAGGLALAVFALRPATPMRPAATDWRPYCWSAADQVRDTWSGMAGARADDARPVSAFADGPPANLACPVKAAIGAATIRVAVRCARSGDWACVEVTGVERADGRPLDRL